MSAFGPHPMCLPCWRTHKGNFVASTALADEYRELETCCFCGDATLDGIYVRHDGKTISHCPGHD